MPISLGDPQPALLVDQQGTDGIEAVGLPGAKQGAAAPAADLAGGFALSREDLHLLIWGAAAYIEAANRVHRQVDGVVQPRNERLAFTRLWVDGQHGPAVGDSIHQAIVHGPHRAQVGNLQELALSGPSLHRTRPTVPS